MSTATSTRPSPRPVVVTTREALAEARAALPGTVAVVMTMGSLHQGHLSLVRRAHDEADHVIVSIFVNPLQFGPAEDFATYPRDIDADLALLGTGPGVDIVFCPSGRDMYPEGRPTVTVAAGPVGARVEGRSRAGHFDGVLTVVTILLHLTRPDVAVFGEKDAQQLALVTLMVDQLAFGVRIAAVPTVRERDGLASSSRNARLTPVQRRAAVAVPQAVAAGLAAFEASDGDPAAAHAAATARLRAEPGVHIDHVAVVDPTTYEDVTSPTGAAGGPLRAYRLVLAVDVGGVRLIDNVLLTRS